MLDTVERIAAKYVVHNCSGRRTNTNSAFNLFRGERTHLASGRIAADIR